MKKTQNVVLTGVTVRLVRLWLATEGIWRFGRLGNVKVRLSTQKMLKIMTVLHIR